MVILRFKHKEDHSELLSKVRKMEKFAKEIAECIEDGYEDDGYDDYETEYRRGRTSMRRGRYGLRDY